MPDSGELAGILTVSFHLFQRSGIDFTENGND